MKKMRKISFLLVLLTSIVLGITIGSGVAFASDIWETLSTGTNNVGGTQSESPWWQYDANYTLNMNFTRTQVDVSSTSYTNGSVDDFPAHFKNLWIYDEYGYDSHCFWDFFDYQVNWTPLSATTTWTMDQLSTANNYVIFQQLIKYRPSTYSDNVICYTGSGTP